MSEENEVLEEQQAIYLMRPDGPNAGTFRRTLTYENGDVERLVFPVEQAVEVSQEAFELLERDIKNKVLQRCPPPASLVDGKWEFQ